MANLIRLKQIEGSEQLQSAISAGEAIGTGSFASAVDFAVSQSLQTSLSASIINIITNNVGAVLPDGVVSGSSQIYISGTIGYSDLATDLEVAVVSASISSSQLLISSSISSSIASTLSGSLLSVTNLSSSVSTSLSLLSSSIQSVSGDFSSSVARTFATQSTNITLLSSSSNSRLNNLEITSASINDKFNTLEIFTSSLDNGFATDYEVFVTTSNIIDQGEW